MQWAKISSLVVAAVVWCGAAQADEYTLPEDFEGMEIDSTEGNPAEMDGVPMWRVDQVWPGKPMEAENYTPMVWEGTKWHAKENSHAGQPAVDVGEERVVLVSRSAWSGNPGHKLSALIFIAPSAGTYDVAGTFSLNLWHGDKAKPIALRILKIDKAAGKVSKIKKKELVSDEPRELEGISVTLAKGDEIAFVPTFPQMHMASSLTVTDLIIAKQADDE